MVEFQPRLGTTTYLDSFDNSMCSFLPLLVFHRPLVLPHFQLTPTHMPLLRTTPPRSTTFPTDHYRPRVNLPTWMSPGYRYIESLLYGSLVTPLESPSYTTIISLCLPHVSRLTTLPPPLSTPDTRPPGCLYLNPTQRISL